MVLYLKDLNPTLQNPKVAVKILREWPPHFIQGQPFYQSLILVDERGNRIDAKIDAGLYVDCYYGNLNEGDWYEISGFLVIEGQQSFRNSNHPFEILIQKKTKMVPINPRSTDNFILMYDALKMHNSTPDEKNCCVDVLGMVVHVNEPQIIDFLDHQNGYISENEVVTFTILEHNGQEIECVAVGSVCTAFFEKRKKIISSPTYTNQPIVCTLLFWRISVYEGMQCLMSQLRCSKIILEDEVAGINTGDMLSWLDVDSSDEDNEDED
ncbi:PREDICTED: uncharacterized protein LOC104773142 [Camelina sativa]|uniref:Uncharacterized protein LOC104773142 n=1 Tax=Camelina sativa TaxID=90675 RepID=A0ABM0Y5V6_CAMSA|nr:PREDICTED: uncharacterized protein LOC104773142 [Camelina sativa]